MAMSILTVGAEEINVYGRERLRRFRGGSTCHYNRHSHIFSLGSAGARPCYFHKQVTLALFCYDRFVQPRLLKWWRGGSFLSFFSPSSLLPLLFFSPSPASSPSLVLRPAFSTPIPLSFSLTNSLIYPLLPSHQPLVRISNIPRQNGIQAGFHHCSWCLVSFLIPPFHLCATSSVSAQAKTST